jgi:hypothetical protein
VNPEIHRVLRGTPGKLAFRALCRAVTPDLVARCDDRLRSWPDELREAPWSWLAALESGHSKTAWPLVRSLDLTTDRCQLRDVALPDPRVRPEVRAVTRLNLVWALESQLAALAGTIDHWEHLRSVHFTGLSSHDDEHVAALAATGGVTRLESLVLGDVREQMFHSPLPSFRAVTTMGLEHVGLRAPDLTHLLRNGFAPRLRSADVLVATVDEARELADCPQLRTLERLAVGFRCGFDGRQPPLGKPFFGNVVDEHDTAAAEFFGRADLTGLRALTVRGVRMGLGREGLGARGIDAIIAGGVLGRLAELTLELLPVGDDTIARVVGALDHSRIERLTLANLVATDRTAAAFAAAGEFLRLTHLDLRENHLGEAGVRQLVEVPMPALTHLDLSGVRVETPYYWRTEPQPIGDAGARAVAASCRNLTSLRLAATGITAAGLGAVLELPLEELDVAHNLIGAVPDHPWPTLRTLDLTDCSVADLGSFPAEAPRLESISLAYNDITSVPAWPVLPRLWAFDLHDHVMSDEELTAFATSGAAERLLELDLEQECGNALCRRYDTSLPRAVVEGFPALDAVFLGVVDEYHGARYSCGFTASDRDEVSRPEFAAFLSHVETGELIEEESERRSDLDFRSYRAGQHAKVLATAREFARRTADEA